MPMYSIKSVSDSMEQAGSSTGCPESWRFELQKTKLLIIPAILLVLGGCAMEVTPGNPNQTVPVTQPAQTQSVATTVPVATKPPLAPEDQAKLKEWEEKIYPGTTINKIDVSGLTLDQAKKKVEKELMDPLKDRRVRFSYANKKNYMSYNKLEVAIDETVYQQALANGKDATDEEKLKFIEEGKPLELDPVLVFNDAYVLEMMEEIQENLTALSHQFAAKRVDGKVVLKSGATEEVLDRDAFQAAVREAVDFSPKNNPYIEVPVTKIPVTITQAQLDAIDKRIARFSSNYGWSYDARKFNVKHAAGKISGSLIMPGQEFSFNQSIGGGAGTSNGFQNSGVYVGLDMVTEPGGGVCQVSSTMYNVILKLGITPTQRKNHGMSIGYLPPGMDAVIYAPSLDLRFKNPFDDPIYITTSADGDTLTFNVYGAADAMGGYSYKYEQEVYKEEKAEIKEMKDPTIPKGAIVLDPVPHNGSSARVYKLTYKNGKLISRKLYTDNTYRRSDGIRRIGTGVGSQVNKKWYFERKVLQYPKGWDGPR